MTCWRNCRSASAAARSSRANTCAGCRQASGPNLRVIPTTDILFFRAEDKYVRVQTKSFEALIRKPIKELIDELDPDEFWQIHRATVVRVDAVEQVSRNFRGHQVVHVKGSTEKLEVSRTFNHLFKQM